MEQELKCNLLLTLEEMSLRSVVVLSLSGSAVFDNVSQVRYPLLISEESREWRRRLENVVKDELSKLKLPLTLLNQAKDLVRPIVAELRRGMLLHSYRENSTGDKHLPDSTKLCWTSVGEIDDRKTAENLVRSDLIDLETRYRIACRYCLEGSIRRLWTELPEERKAHYSSGYLDNGHLVFFWGRCLSGQLSSMNHLLRENGRILTSFNQWMFECWAENGERAATRHFFGKLTFTEKEASLMRTAHKLPRNSFYDENVSEVIHYLLTVMTPQERRKMVEEHPIDVLLSFLRWPLQDIFLENARLLCTFLTPDVFCRLLWKMAFVLEWGGIERNGQYCPEMFGEFFIQSSPEQRKSFARQRIRGSIPARAFLSLFLRFEDSESIEVVFRNVEEEDKVEIVFDPEIKDLFFHSICEGRWHLVELCLREATLSEDDEKRWKERFMDNYGARIQRVDWNWKGFFEFFDEKERGQKRKLAELLEGCSSEQ